MDDQLDYDNDRSFNGRHSARSNDVVFETLLVQTLADGAGDGTEEGTV
jgi:hypothetical protein